MYNKDYFKYAHRVYAKRWLHEFTEQATKFAEMNPRDTRFSKTIIAHLDVINFIKFLMDSQFVELKVTLVKEDGEYHDVYEAVFTIDWS
jgi:hypothetical protein